MQVSTAVISGSHYEYDISYFDKKWGIRMIEVVYSNFKYRPDHVKNYMQHVMWPEHRIQFVDVFFIENGTAYA